MGEVKASKSRGLIRSHSPVPSSLLQLIEDYGSILWTTNASTAGRFITVCSNRRQVSSIPLPTGACKERLVCMQSACSSRERLNSDHGSDWTGGMGKRLCSTQPASGLNVQSSAAVGVPSSTNIFLLRRYCPTQPIQYRIILKEEGSWVIPRGCVQKEVSSDAGRGIGTGGMKRIRIHSTRFLIPGCGALSPPTHPYGISLLAPLQLLLARRSAMR